MLWPTGVSADEGGAAGTLQRPVDNMPCDAFVPPLRENEISSLFGPRRSLASKKEYHKGVDYSAPIGTLVLAAGEGEVVEMGRNATYGRFVTLEHASGVRTLYAHLAQFSKWLSIGSLLDQGEAIGKLGRSGRTTGPNLHFEIWSDGKRVDPLTILADQDGNPCDASR